MHELIRIGQRNVLKALTLIFGSLLFLAGCGSSGDPLPDPDTGNRLVENKSISIAGDARNYHLYLPENPAVASIVLMLHGHSGSADQILGLNGTKAPFKAWLEIARRENLMLVVPDGELGSDNQQGWNDCRSDATNNPSTNDSLFLTELLDQVIADYSTSTPKIFVTGISNGGFMTQRLAQEIPERLSAIAIIVSQKTANSVCAESSVPVPVLFMNGTEDPLVPYNGGNINSDRGEVLSTQATIDYWVSRNQTDITAIETSIADTNGNDGSTIRRLSYQNGINGADVVLFEVVGGGHTEPSIAERYGGIYRLIVGSQNGDFEMADEVWDFFNR